VRVEPVGGEAVWTVVREVPRLVRVDGVARASSHSCASQLVGVGDDHLPLLTRRRQSKRWATCRDSLGSGEFRAAASTLGGGTASARGRAKPRQVARSRVRLRRRHFKAGNVNDRLLTTRQVGELVGPPSRLIPEPMTREAAALPSFTRPRASRAPSIRDVRSAASR
jgi:hypothetical protein